MHMHIGKMYKVTSGLGTGYPVYNENFEVIDQVNDKSTFVVVEEIPCGDKGIVSLKILTENATVGWMSIYREHLILVSTEKNA